MEDKAATTSGTKAAREAASKASAAAQDGFQWPVKDLIQTSEAFAKRSFELAHQWVAFGQARVEDDLKSLTTLCACRNLEEIVECQQEAAVHAASQYLDQVRKFTSQLTSLVAEMPAPFAKERLLVRNEVSKAVEQ